MAEELPVVKPRRRNTKERIIDEAESLAAVHGIEHLKLQDVADRIGIKLPSVYAHFSGREDILAAMAARVNRAFSQFYYENNNAPAIQTLRVGANEFLDFLTQNPAYFRLILRDLSVPMGYNPQNRSLSLANNNAMSPELKEMINRAERLLKTAQNENAISALSGAEFISAVHGTLLLRLSWTKAPTVSDTEEVACAIDVEPIKNGLKVLLDRLLSVSA